MPATPNSELKTILQYEIDRSEFKVRVIENAGLSIKQCLQKSDPFRGSHCLRNDCQVCGSGGSGRCDRTSALYRITCTECDDVYYGETSRNAYARCREHGRALVEKDLEKSPLWKHCVLKHMGVIQEFRYDVVRTFKNDAMLRQISESVAISRVNPASTMNGRFEWNQPRVPRVHIFNH